MDPIVYLNGEYLPLAEARIPVLDRGFIFGDGVYEVIPAYGRRLFRLREHLARLEHSLRAVRIASPFDAAGWTALLESVVARNAWDDQSVYLQVTRGVAPRTQEFPKGDVRPTVFVMASALKMPTPEQRANGVAVVTRDDYRWRRCDIKSVSLLANCLLRQEAEDAGAAETVLVRDGNVKEASTCNVFLVKDGVILNPPKDNLILHGITFDLALELARAAGIPVATREVRREELYAADEVWLSSSAREVLPVTTVDGRRVGSGRPGPLYARMHALFQDYKARARAQADG
ncbi:MAG: D-amino acid aminotransferase [Burkholderiales bacterium]